MSILIALTQLPKRDENRIVLPRIQPTRPSNVYGPPDRRISFNVSVRVVGPPIVPASRPCPPGQIAAVEFMGNSPRCKPPKGLELHQAPESRAVPSRPASICKYSFNTRFEVFGIPEGNSFFHVWTNGKLIRATRFESRHPPANANAKELDRPQRHLDVVNRFVGPVLQSAER